MKPIYVIWWLDQDGEYHHDIAEVYEQAHKLAEDTSREWGRAELEYDDQEGFVDIYEEGHYVRTEKTA